MKALLLALLFFAGNGWAASLWTPVPLADYTLDNTLADATGRFTNVVNTGPAVFTSSPTPPRGSQWIGSFASGRYLSFSAALCTSISAATNWTIYFQNVSIPTAIDNNVLWSSGTGYFFRPNADGTVTWSNNVSGFGSAASFTSGTLCQLAVRYNGTNTRIYKGAPCTSTGCPAWVDVGTNVGLSGTLALSNMYVGNYTGGTTFPFNGITSGFMLYNSALDAPPTLASTNNTDKRGLSLDTVMRPDLATP